MYKSLLTNLHAYMHVQPHYLQLKKLLTYEHQQALLKLQAEKDRELSAVSNKFIMYMYVIIPREILSQFFCIIYRRLTL